MGEAISRYVFVDSNVLINDFFYRNGKLAHPKHATNAISFLRAKPNIRLFCASFSLIQFVSTLDKAKISNEVIADELNRILGRFTLVDLTAKDFQKALSIPNKDTEGAVQYTLCRKARCLYIITDNVKDFRIFRLVETIKPKDVEGKLFL